jgi:hypothetical protein
MARPLGERLVSPWYLVKRGSTDSTAALWDPQMTRVELQTFKSNVVAFCQDRSLGTRAISPWTDEELCFYMR